MSSNYLREDLQGQTGSGSLLDWVEQIAARAEPGDVFRDKEGRRTLRFVHLGRAFFLKLHRGVGWAEILKNLLQLRLPITSARNEFAAVRRLESLGVDTLSIAAFSLEGSNPATLHSMLVTDELTGTISLEDYCTPWLQAPPSATVKRRLIDKVADTARRMHESGINHRDFYLCHFHLAPESLATDNIRCHLIDLHRAQLRNATPRRWQVKDLAGLYFSAMDCGLSGRDLLRFVRAYSGVSLREVMKSDASLWQQVERKALKLYRREHGREPPPVR